MKRTINTTFLFLLAIAAVAGSRALSGPQELQAERAEIRRVLDRPAFRLPADRQGLPNEANENTKGLAGLAYLTRLLSVPAPELKAHSVLVRNVDASAQFLARNPDERRPIASITKLVTAAVAIERADITQEVAISEYAVSTEGDAGKLRPGERVSLEALLHAMLMESSNDAAIAVAEHISGNVGAFVSLMNEKAASIGLKNTFFADPVGLRDDTSFSTASDLAELLEYLRREDRYHLIWETLQKPSAQFISGDGIEHSFTNNNPFIAERGGVVGGKTGYTGGAGESMVMLGTSPDGATEIIFVVLGSQDRFADMRTLINWVASAFLWEKPLSK